MASVIITLIEPKIPPNTGNIARLCAATGTKLNLVGKLGFELSDRYLKRAGLDYWKYVDWEYFPDIDAYIESLDINSIHLFTARSDISYTKKCFGKDDILIFGKETNGLDEKYLKKYKERCCTIPILEKGVRSLNLSSAAAIALYEALRQQGRI